MDNTQPEEAAAAWFMREKSGALTSRESQERDAWLALNPEHREAYRRARALWGELDALAADPPMRALRQQALQVRPAGIPSLTRRMMTVAAAVAVVAVGGVVAYLYSSFTPRESVAQYRTGIGERSTVTLDDGSTVMLNTASQLSVRFGRAERTVELLSGQAYFVVARERRRPFVVVAADRRVEALGTAFDVRVEQGHVQVVLVEGKVAVSPLQSTRAEVELEPGERFESGGKRAGKVVATNVEHSTSWRSGRVVFADTSLGDAVAEINRYRFKPILIGDAAAANLRISGTYRVTEVDRFPEALAAYYPLRLLQRPSGETVLVIKDQ